MKKAFNTSMVSLLTFSIILLISCGTNLNNTQKGAGAGAVIGGILGGVIGNNVGNKKNSALGAILGATIGGVAGGVIGKKMDRNAREIEAALPGARVERVGEGIKVTLGENSVRFNTDEDRLTPKAKNNLDRLTTVLKQNPDTNIKVIGYTDYRGSDEYNQNLSERRARSVVSYLTERAIGYRRLSSEGRGESEPVASNETIEGRKLNRRVEFAITANEKMIKDAQREVRN